MTAVSWKKLLFQVTAFWKAGVGTSDGSSAARAGPAKPAPPQHRDHAVQQRPPGPR